MDNIIVIMGPTGVGKTKLSIELAKKLDAEIINGDSVSVYKKLDIGSAKPSLEERSGIPHHLIDICELNDSYSVYDYQKDVRKLIKEISSRKKRIIIVGGTGLYIKAALFNYEFSPSQGENLYNELSNEEIKDKLIEYGCNQELDVNNRRRLTRLLSKYQNNEKISYKKDELLYPCTFIGLTTEREVLYSRINKRVEQMIKSGLVEEVTSLKDYYKTSRVLSSAIGYKEFYDYLYEDKSLDEVIENIQQNLEDTPKGSIPSLEINLILNGLKLIL